VAGWPLAGFTQFLINVGAWTEKKRRLKKVGWVCVSSQHFLLPHQNKPA
jgi:hypothetical protein